MGGSSSTSEQTTENNPSTPASPEQIVNVTYTFDEYIDAGPAHYITATGVDVSWLRIAVGKKFVDTTPYSKLSITLPGDEKEPVTYKSYPVVKDFQTPFQSISPESYPDYSFDSPFNLASNRREFSATSAIDYEKLFSEIYPTDLGFISYPTYGMSASLVNVDITPFKGMVDAAIANDKAAFLKSAENFWFSDPVRRLVRYNLFNSGILSNFFNRIAVVKNPSQPVFVILPGGLEVNAVDSSTKMPTEITTKYTGDYTRWDYSRFKADFDRCMWSNTEVAQKNTASSSSSTSQVTVKVDFDVCVHGSAMYNIFELRLYEISDISFKCSAGSSINCHLIVPILVLTQERRHEIIQASLGDRAKLISTSNNEELFILDVNAIVDAENMDLNRIPGINVSSVASKYYADKTVRTITYKDLVSRYSESIRYLDDDRTCNGLHLRFSDYAVVSMTAGQSATDSLYVTKKDMKFFNPSWFLNGYMKVLNDKYFLEEMKYIRKFIADNHISSVEGHIIQSLINELQ